MSKIPGRHLPLNTVGNYTFNFKKTAATADVTATNTINTILRFTQAVLT